MHSVTESNGCMCECHLNESLCSRSIRLHVPTDSGRGFTWASLPWRQRARRWAVSRLEVRAYQTATWYECLRPGAKANRSRDRALYDAAVRHFGSWRGALTAAGVNLTNVTHRRPKHLDREGMILWLRNRQATGQSLVFSEVCLENRAHALAIRRTFGSWAKAIAALNTGALRSTKSVEDQ